MAQKWRTNYNFIMIFISAHIIKTARTQRSVILTNHTVKQAWRILIGIFLVANIAMRAEAQTAREWFEKGLEPFRWGRTDEAIVFFDKAVAADPLNDTYLLYLGICYHQSKRYEGADRAYSKGIELNGSEHDRLLLNRGNLRASRGDIDGAASDYTRLLSRGGLLASSALLGRANLALNQSSFEEALNDYTEYLVREPYAPQRATIEKLIGLLGAQLAADAEAAMLAQERARMDEERRLAEEALRAEEEARQAALLAEVLQSLSGSGEDTSSISAGMENLQQEFEESALEE